MPNTSATGGYLTPTTPNPATDFNLDRKVNDLVAGTVGLSGSLVRPRWQPEPAPIPASSVDWIAFGKIRQDSQSGSPYIEHDGAGDGGNGLDRLYHVAYLHYMATFYGPNCEQFAQLLVDGLEITQNHEVSLVNSISLREIGAPVFVPEQVNQVWYRRVDVELVFEHKYTREYAVQNILHADGQVHSQSPDPNGPIVDVTWNTENLE